MRGIRYLALALAGSVALAATASAQAVERDLEVNVALPGEDELTEVGVVIENQRRILLQHPLNGAGKLDLVVPVVGVDRQRNHRGQRRREGSETRRTLA